MNKKVIFIGIAIIGIGIVGYYVYSKQLKKPTKREFDKLVSDLQSKGKDVFGDKNTYDRVLKGFLTLSRKEVNRLKEIFGKEDSQLTEQDKKDLDVLQKKLVGWS